MTNHTIFSSQTQDLSNNGKSPGYHHGATLSRAEKDAIDTVVKISPEFAEAARKFNTQQLAGTTSTGSEKPKTRWTLAELTQTEFPEPMWIVPDTIPVGLSFLAGRPKLGKSWLGLQITHAVGTGGQLFGIRVPQGHVLYLALEDSPRRLRERTARQHFPLVDTIVFETQWKPLPEGGLADLEREVTESGFQLVIIDTFSRALGGRPDQLDPGDMTTVVGGLQQMALSRGIGVVVIDHHRKSNGMMSDPIDDILGSTAKSAVADCALGLYRDSGKQEATFKVTGRDMAEREMRLVWDGELCCWQYTGEAGHIKEGSERGSVLIALRSLHEDGELPTTSNIAELTEMHPSSVNTCLADLVNSGLVKKGKKKGREQPYYPVER